MGRKKRSIVQKLLAGTSWTGPKLALSSTERSRAHRDKARDIGELPPIRHVRVRESCRLDLLRFGVLYCVGSYEGMKPLLKRPPSPRMERFVKALEDKILNGGLKHVRWPRGKGKSTWVKIAIIWAAIYGHKFFMVIVEKTKGMAKVVVEEIWKRIYLSPRISVDFPEFSVPMDDVKLSPQRMRSQTYNGKPTYMKQEVINFCYFKLPTMDGHANTGAIIAFRGADQALRGINIESARPDFFFLDDPQTDNDAKNPETVKKIEANISGAVLGSGDLDERISAVMASTPIEPNDVSEVFADPDKHPEWETETECLVVKFGPKDLMAKYLATAKVNERDAHQFYLDHRAEIERGAVMMDDSDYSPSVEASAYEHALYLLHTLKSESFYANYQMTPTKMQGVYHLSVDGVASRVNGSPMGVVPAECDQGVVAYCDVNVKAGLRWEICAFGRGRIAAILAYGQYPAEGQRLYPEDLPKSAIPIYLKPAIRNVANAIRCVKLVDSEGKSVHVPAVCFDGGWQTETVATVVAEMNAAASAQAGRPVAPFAWSKGFNSQQYSRYFHEKAASGKIKGLSAAEECHTWSSANGIYLAVNADHWKEISQTSFLANPLTQSSSSFYGSEPLVHRQFAQEICNEELVSKESSTKFGAIYKWDKDPSRRPNHYGDVHAGALAFGAIRGNFDRITEIATSDELAASAVTRRKKRKKYVYKRR